MNLYDLIQRRRTIRRFKPDPVPREILLRLVNAGRLAPSGSNLQPLEFIIVDKPELLPPVFATTAWAGYLGPAGPPPEGKRPTAYIVVLINRDILKSGGQHDVGAAMENMILLALAEGYGSCWIGSINRKKLAQILNIPGNRYIDAILALGVPAEQAVAEPMTTSIRYYRDDQGVHRVPKRALEDILYLNRFGIGLDKSQPR